MTTPAQTHARPLSHNQALGARGEALAEQYLLERGYRLLAKNWRCRHGEIDLIMRDGDTIVAVEVKTRSGSGFGSPLEAITVTKANRVRMLLLEWLRERRTHAPRLRIDAIGIVIRPGTGAPRIDHLRGIS